MPNMGEIVKSVRTDFRVDVHQIDTATKKVDASFTRLAAGAGRLDAKIGRAFRFFTSPVAGLLGAAGFGMLTKGILDAGRAAEDSELQISSLLLSAQKSSNLMVGGFTEAHRAAKALRAEFKQLAIESPVGFEDIQKSFGLMATPLSKAGLSLREQAMFSRDVAVRGKLEGRDNATVGNDVAQILSGIGGQRQITTFALKSISEQAAKLAKSGKLAEAAEMIRGALTMTPEELKAFEGSFTGMLSTLQDHFVTLKEHGAKPVMGYLIAKMGEWAKWLSKNQDKAEAIARTIGTKVTAAIKTAVRLSEWLARHWDGVLTTINLIVSARVGLKFLAFMGSAVDLAQKFKSAMMMGTAAAEAAGGSTAAAKGIKKLWGKGKWGKVAAVVAGVGAATASFFGLQGLFGDDEEGGGGPKANGLKGIDVEQFRSMVAGSILDTAGPAMTERMGGGGGGTRKVRKLVVERAEFRERDFSRFSAPQLAGTSRRNIVGRPIAGLGLGQAMVGR